MKRIMLALSFLIAAPSSAGTATSGGGGAFVRRESENGVVKTKSQLIDLWEAENIPFAWPNGVGVVAIDHSKDGIEPFDEVNAALDQLQTIDAPLAAQVRSDFHYLIGHRHDLPPNISIQLPDDLKLAYYPSGTTPEGMMRFNGLTGLLDVNKEIFDALATKLDIAASWLHEAIYKTMRESVFAHQNSVASRHLNACLLSKDLSCIGHEVTPLPTDRWVFACRAGDLNFYVYPLSAQAPYYPAGYRIQFTKFGDAIPSFDTFQEVHDVVFNRDGSMVGESSGMLRGPLELFNYGPGTAAIQLSLNSQGYLKSVTSVKAISALRGGSSIATGELNFYPCTLMAERH